MIQTLILNWIPTDQNTYINAERTNRFMASKIKKEETENVYWSCKEQGLQPMVHPVIITFNYHTVSLRKDPDNTSFAKKYILDGIVKAGVLPNDGRKQIYRFVDNFYGATEDKVEVILNEAI